MSTGVGTQRKWCVNRCGYAERDGVYIDRNGVHAGMDEQRKNSVHTGLGIQKCCAFRY